MTLDPVIPSSDAESGVWLTPDKPERRKTSRRSQVLDWFAGKDEPEQGAEERVRKWIGPEAAELVFDELRHEVDEGHRRLDALRARVTRMFALSGVLLAVIAAFAASLDTWWAAFLFIPVIFVVVAFGLVWHGGGRSRTRGSLAYELRTNATFTASSSQGVRLGMIPVFAKAIQENDELYSRRRQVLTRAENLLALAMIAVVVCVLVASPLVE